MLGKVLGYQNLQGSPRRKQDFLLKLSAAPAVLGYQILASQHKPQNFVSYFFMGHPVDGYPRDRLNTSLTTSGLYGEEMTCQSWKKSLV